MPPFTRRQTLGAAGGLAALAAGVRGARAAEPSVTSPALEGWREALVIVADFDPWIETLTAVGGWEVALRTRADTALNALWSLPGKARTEQVLMRNLGTTSGHIRLIKVHGAPQRRIRPDDQAWETGGLSALDLRVVDMDATRAALMARGWRAPSDPVRYKTYGVEVIQWAPSSPDGVRLSFIQRISPALTGWPELKRWSRTTNAAITVGDMDAAARFFGEALGFKQASASDTLGSGGHNVMGLPWRVAETTPVDIRGFAAPGSAGGAVELISLPQVRGRDHSADAHPPNLGIAGLRYLVAEADALAGRLAGRGVKITAPATTLSIAPYGRCRAFAIRSPDGAWLEFVEPQGRSGEGEFWSGRRRPR